MGGHKGFEKQRLDWKHLIWALVEEFELDLGFTAVMDVCGRGQSSTQAFMGFGGTRWVAARKEKKEQIGVALI